MKVFAVGAVPDHVLRAMTARVGGHHALRLALRDDLHMLESIPMDEFTRDVLFGPVDGFWLAYDTT